MSFERERGERGVCFVLCVSVCALCMVGMVFVVHAHVGVRVCHAGIFTCVSGLPATESSFPLPYFEEWLWRIYCVSPVVCFSQLLNQSCFPSQWRKYICWFWKRAFSIMLPLLSTQQFLILGKIKQETSRSSAHILLFSARVLPLSSVIPLCPLFRSSRSDRLPCKCECCRNSPGSQTTLTTPLKELEKWISVGICTGDWMTMFSHSLGRCKCSYTLPRVF